MITAGIANIKVAVLASNIVEQIERTDPDKVLKPASAQVSVIAPKCGQIQNMNHDEKGEKLPVDLCSMRWCCRAGSPARIRCGQTRKRWRS